MRPQRFPAPLFQPGYGRFKVGCDPSAFPLHNIARIISQDLFEAQ
jgi:hypothetical protein